MININYNISLKIRNKINNLIMEFTKNKVYETNLTQEQCFGKKFALFEGNLYDMFDDEICSYVINNNITYCDIELSNFDIKTNDENIEIEISNKENVTLDLNIIIDAYYLDNGYIETPTLVGKVIERNKIMLFLPSSEYAHNVYDENDNLIYSVSCGTNSYIEENLDYNKEYKRKITSYNSHGESSCSNLLILKTDVEKKSLIKRFNPNDKRINNISEIPKMDKRLKAFKNGIGNSNDLKIYKPDELDFVNKFNVMADIHGKYTKIVNTFQKASFDYRIACTGKYENEVTEGFAKFKLKAQTSASVKLKIYRYSYRYINISWKVTAKVSYNETVNGKVESKIKEIHYTGKPFKVAPVVKIKGNYAYLESQQNILVDSTPLKQMIKIEAKKAGINENQIDKIYDYKIFDNYPFNKYDGEGSWEMSPSHLGTFVMHTMNRNIVDENSGIYASGYANAQLFDVEKVITKNFYGETGNIDVLTKSEVENILPSNVDDRRCHLPEDKSIETITKIEIVSVDPGIKLNEINLEKDVVLSGTANLSHNTPELQYQFSGETKEVRVSSEELFGNIIVGDTEKIDYDYTLSVTSCTDNISCTCGNGNKFEQQLKPGQVLKWTDSAYTTILLEAASHIEILDYEDILPGELYEPYHGVINNEINEFGECIKKDMVVQTPSFHVPQNIYDVKYRVLLKNVRPDDAHINYKFFHEYDTGYTDVNGDYLTFTSEANHKTEKEFTDYLSSQLCETISVPANDSSTLKLYANITKPPIIDLVSNKYTKFELRMYTNATDVIIDEYYKEIFFDNFNELTIPYKVKIMKNATAKWCPLIKNGYYYLNQHEHYLYSETDIKSSYEDTFKCFNKNSSYNIKVSLAKSENQNFNKIYTMREGIDYNKKDTLIFNEYLYPKPIIDGAYYKEYMPFEEVIKELNFETLPTKYNYIKWKLSKNSNEITLFARVYNNEINEWTEWTELYSNTSPSLPLSYKMQLKAKFVPEVENIEEKIVETLSTYAEFYNECDHEISKDIYLASGCIQQISPRGSVYFSKVIDYGISTKFKVDAYYTAGTNEQNNKVNIFAASSDNAEIIKNNPKWILMDGLTSVTGRYVRYRLDFEGRSNVLTIYKTINTTKTITKPQGINNIQVSIQNDYKENEAKIINIDKPFNIDFDKKDKIICYNLLNEIEYPIKSSGYKLEDITNVEVTHNDDDISLRTERIDYSLNDKDIIKVFEGWTKTEVGIDYWVLDNTEKSLKNIKSNNKGSFYVSPNKYNNWRITTRVYCDDNKRNPIGIVIGYEVDSNKKEHTLTLLVSPTKKVNGHKKKVCFSVYYNYNTYTEKLIYNGEAKIEDNDVQIWNESDTNIIIDVAKHGNILRIARSQNGKDIADPGTEVGLDLDQYPELAIFKGSTRFGFCTYELQNTKFKDIMILIDDIVNAMVIAKTNTVKTIPTNSEYIEFVNNVAVMSPLPQQFSPITVLKEDNTPLKRVSFISNGKYSLTNKETFTKVNNSIKLKYSDINKKSLNIFINNSKVNIETNPYELINNYIFFENNINNEDTVDVYYSLNNSFVVNYNIPRNEIEVKLSSEESIEKAIVKYETNEYDSRRRIEHLSLNPLYNMCNQGFIYLSDNAQIPTRIEIYSNFNYVAANGLDNLTICARLFDEYDNPVPGEELNLSCEFGRVRTLKNITDSNGTICFKYYSSIKECTDYIKVEHKEYKLYETIKINNLEV